MQMVFSKGHPACYSIVNGIKPLRIAQKLMLGHKVIYVRCISCLYNNVAKSIRLLDKKAILVYTGKFSCK